MSAVFAAFVGFAALAATLGFASSVPAAATAPQQQQQQQDAAGTTGAGVSAVFWSVMDDCFGGEDLAATAAVCLKTKALTALDRALSKPAVTIAEGVSLAARAGKSLNVDQLLAADRTDRAALDAVKDVAKKSAMLDDMLANRVDALMSTRTIVMDAPAAQEGRGKKSKDKTMKKAMMMVGMMAVAVMGPMAMKMIALIAIKALIVGKIALVLSIIMLVKKLMSQQQHGGGGGGSSSSSSYESEPAPYARSMQFDAHSMAYSGHNE